MADTTTLVVFCALGIVWQLVEAGFGPSAGPYDLKITQLESCADEGTGQIHFGSKINSAGKGKHFYSSPYVIGVPIDDQFKIYIDMQQWGNGGYKPRSIEYTTKNCDDLWKFGKDMLISLSKSAGITVTKCPLPKGNYTANNWELDGLQLNNFPTLTYNKYKIINTFQYKGTKVGCLVIYVEVEAKKDT